MKTIPNRTRFTLVSLLTIAIATVASACVRFPGLPQRPDPPPNSNSAAKDVLAVEVDPLSGADPVEKEFNDLLQKRDFRAIEAGADMARKKKERLPGAYWKLDAIYNGLTNFYAEYKGQRVTDEMWTTRIELLKQWKLVMPDSITARVALAKAYADHGWFARGDGFINTVSRKDYEVFDQRLATAEQELLEARNLNSRCPRWYREMMMIAMAKGWALEEFEELYNAAIKAEPNYLQYYLVKSEYLTPKWSGRDGDWQSYVDSLPGKLATLESSETDTIYFVVVVNKLRDSSLGVNWAMIAKDRVKRGFAEIEEKYGVDNFRLNQYAFVSLVTQDLENSRKAFDRIGNDRDNKVWGEQMFNSMKKIAVEGSPKPKQ